MAGKITKTINDIKEYIEANSKCKLLTNSKYTGMNQKMDFLCECGKVFTIAFNSFKAKQYKMCRSCANKIARGSNRLKIEDIKKVILETSECELLESEYINNHTKMKFKCGCGEEFYTSWEVFSRKTPNNTNKKCNKCTSQYTWRYSEVIEFVRKNSECELLEDGYRTLHTKMKFKCGCGEEFYATFREFRDRMKRRCNACSKKRSSFEEHIAHILKKHNIRFVEQYTYDDCIGAKGVNKTPFDFYLPDYNTLIEADGQQHFEIKFGESEERLLETQHNDSIKTKFCMDNNIPLIRIPYWKASKSEKIILEKLNKYANTEVS